MGSVGLSPEREALSRQLDGARYNLMHRNEFYPQAVKYIDYLLDKWLKSEAPAEVPETFWRGDYKVDPVEEPALD
jgi:hypothetical protein